MTQLLAPRKEIFITPAAIWRELVAKPVPEKAHLVVEVFLQVVGDKYDDDTLLEYHATKASVQGFYAAEAWRPLTRERDILVAAIVKVAIVEALKDHDFDDHD